MVSIHSMAIFFAGIMDAALLGTSEIFKPIQRLNLKINFNDYYIHLLIGDKIISLTKSGW